METKKDNSFLALFSSFAICLLGSISFGIFYGLGYYNSPFIYIVTAVQIIVAYMVFSVFSKINLAMGIFNFFWTSIWSIGLNTFGFMITESLIICKNSDMNILNGFDTVMDNIKYNPVYSDIFKKLFIYISIITLCTAFICSLFAVINNSIHNRKTKNVNNEKTEKISVNQTFASIFLIVKDAVNSLMKNKDKDKFNLKIKSVVNKQIKPLSNKEKQKMLNFVNKSLKRDKLSNLDRISLTSLLKLLNSNI